ncbi:hypothetical protein BGI10_10585 [Snodgrassella alvi]|nr:hypothetical protein BGI07_09815 [Snodgrassella alvi]ORF29390.1 hypothetical protein BGI10_10585 [Snodgrassella alvi]ORF33602.1 hypothetical protein BGI11_08085 [Snodgrassella alvi]ORF38184.1 hypothetical protein BGI14_09700 [Snodgrassella alvi]
MFFYSCSYDWIEWINTRSALCRLVHDVNQLYSANLVRYFRQPESEFLDTICFVKAVCAGNE